jgi:hypothetical protein
LVGSDSRGIGALGVVLVVVGAALVVLSVAALQWYRVSHGAAVAGGGFTFRDLQQDADQLNAPIAAAYFDWLAFALGVAVTVTGILANVPLPANGPVRVVGFLCGAGGVVGTYYAMSQLFYAEHAAGGSRHGVLQDATYGLWCMFAGFAFAAVGAALGPRQRQEAP